MSEAQPTKTNQIWPCRFRFEIAFRRAFPILLSMPSTFDFCIPTRSTSVPDGPDWLHEVKYDGYRLRLERDGDRVRLITQGRLQLERVAGLRTNVLVPSARQPSWISQSTWRELASAIPGVRR